jgi:hypothetical protein
VSAATVEQKPPGSRADFIFVWVRHVWLVLTIASGIAAAILLDGNANRDVDLLLTWAMVVLCFPTSLLAVPIIAALSHLAESQLAALPKLAGMGLWWGVFFLFGVVQWYVLFPRILKWRLKQ